MPNYIPVVMGDKPVGKIDVNLETGEFSGSLDPAFAHIFRDGIASHLLSVSFMARPEPARSLRDTEDIQAMQDQHDKIRNYGGTDE